MDMWLGATMFLTQSHSMLFIEWHAKQTHRYDDDHVGYFVTQKVYAGHY